MFTALSQGSAPCLSTESGNFNSANTLTLSWQTTPDREEVLAKSDHQPGEVEHDIQALMVQLAAAW